MLKQVDDLSSGPRCMDSGTLWPFVWAFTDQLTGTGHALVTIAEYFRIVRCFTVWIINSKITPSDIDGVIVEQFLDNWRKSAKRRRSAQYSRRYARILHSFIRFLAEIGVVPASAVPTKPKPSALIDERVAAFLDWLRRHRGNSETTITVYGRTIMRLLPALGNNPEAYDATLIRRVILDEAKTHSPCSVQAVAKALRGYLRFLSASGTCRQGLHCAVPTIAHWRLSSLPRYLPPADIEILLKSCDEKSATGKRDRAILLFLARLGLRAGDIRNMRLDDIDWEEGTLRLCGKGRREVRLPLPQDVGDALLDYLNTTRPRVVCDRVFLRSIAPFQPFRDSSAVSDVVDRALARVELVDAPTRGANLLRHSAATAMLRAGATLDTVGTVLRHRSANTTIHYAKVDFLALLQIVQPWPGDLPC